MPRVIRVSNRSKTALMLALIASACAAAGTAGMSACITAPPADLPQPRVFGPTIIQDAVQPSRSQILTDIPPEGIVFIVPVRVDDPTIPIETELFVDYDPMSTNVATAQVPAFATPPALDGGVTDVRVPFSWTDARNVDPRSCHTIEIAVANTFQTYSAHTAGDSLGTDSALWMYQPNGPGTCFQVDAGDGEFPPDAPPDGLLLTTPVGP
jgi:hypothetical protein